MKVHRARQTSIPLQPPLSNKHIYYSGWARLEVSPLTPPTSCYPGQWDSGCTTLGISTRKRQKRKQMALPLSLPAEESRATATVYILEERVSSSDDVLWFFFAALSRLGAVPFPPSFFTTDMSMTSLPQGRSALFIGSTVSSWLMEILIHWPDTASLSAFLFVCCWRNVLPPRFYPQVHPQGCTLHSDVCHINSQTKMHNSFLFFLTALITVVQILTAVVMVIAFRGLWRQ